MGSSPILIGAGNKLIGGFSALGAGGCEFKSHFLDKDHLYGLLFIEHKSMLRESMLELVILFPDKNIVTPNTIIIEELVKLTSPKKTCIVSNFTTLN